MLKFKFNYQNNTLAYQKPLNSELWYEILEEQQFRGNFEAPGFILEPRNHWITFRVQEKNIQAFYKLPEELNGELDNLNDFWTEEKITYYRKYLAKEAEVIFTFSPQEEVEKVKGKWVKKRVY